jgi:hypothetical protein
MPWLPQVLRWLLAAHGFEQFLSRKFPASKRCTGSWLASLTVQ